MQQNLQQNSQILVGSSQSARMEFYISSAENVDDWVSFRQLVSNFGRVPVTLIISVLIKQFAQIKMEI